MLQYTFPARQTRNYLFGKFLSFTIWRLKQSLHRRMVTTESVVSPLLQLLPQWKFFVDDRDNITLAPWEAGKSVPSQCSLTGNWAPSLPARPGQRVTLLCASDLASLLQLRPSSLKKNILSVSSTDKRNLWSALEAVLKVLL